MKKANAMTDHSKLPNSARLRLFSLVGIANSLHYAGDTSWGEFKKLNKDGFDEEEFSRIETNLAVDKVVVRNGGFGGRWMAVLLD